jgi:hypothetical protein
MNAALQFLAEHRESLELSRRGLPGEMSALLLTPRFRASAHVVALVFPAAASTPVLAVKIARLQRSRTVEREAGMLAAARSEHRTPHSIPEVVSLGDWEGHPLLVQEALVGQPMDRASVRRDPAGCVAAALDWLSGFTTETHPPRDSDWLEERVVNPLREFGRLFGAGEEAERAIAIVRTLHGARLPRIFEHGDLSHPNLIWLQSGGLGVVDWELAERDGLPGHDLFHFLAYVGAALSGADSPEAHAAAFRASMETEDGWASAATREYASRLGLADDLLPALLILAWSRYLTGLWERLGASEDGGPDDEARAWIRSHRYAAIWREAIALAERRV